KIFGKLSPLYLGYCTKNLIGSIKAKVKNTQGNNRRLALSLIKTAKGFFADILYRYPDIL
ncbi:MAG: hypothetical protein IKF90_05995, partial [Parasporobacterium sp.]|nr:hypothetical protein [Parasporobacterium sp.]